MVKMFAHLKWSEQKVLENLWPGGYIRGQHFEHQMIATPEDACKYK